MRMFDMNPFNISRRRMLLRPFECRLKWNRLHTEFELLALASHWRIVQFPSKRLFFQIITV